VFFFPVYHFSLWRWVSETERVLGKALLRGRRVGAGNGETRRLWDLDLFLEAIFLDGDTDGRHILASHSSLLSSVLR
jgi:hypothetical protein